MSEQPTISEQIADRITSMVGSIPFVTLQSLFLLAWVTLNALPGFPHPDPYPFILMNLFLSLQAGYTGPFVLISENRQAASDRRTIIQNAAVNERDAVTNQRAAQRIEAMYEDIQTIKKAVLR